MGTDQWHQNVLLVTNDFEIREKISSSFGKETSLTVVETADKAIEHLTNDPVNVVIIDAKTTTTKTHYSEDKEMISFLEIAQYASHVNHNMPIVVLVNALMSKDGTFASKCGATLIMDRKDISQNRMIYVMRVLRKRTFRTVLSRDLTVGHNYPVDLYHYLPINQKYLLFLPAGVEFTEEKRQKITSCETRHLYVKESELNELLTSLKREKKVIYSEQLATIHSKYRKLLIDFFNVSTDGALHFGKLLMDDGLNIIDKIEALIAQYPDHKTCLGELPYPRWSAMAHGINSAIYALIFAKACELQSAREIALAALIHNIGLAEIDQNVLKKKESDLNPTELEEYKKHVEKSLEIIQRKRMMITPLIEKIIAEHHENYDGSGFPKGLSSTNLSLEPALISVLGSFDHLQTLQPGVKAKNFQEVWAEVKLQHTATTQFNKKFHPVIIERLDKFFIN